MNTLFHKIPPCLPFPKGGTVYPSLAKRGEGRFMMHVNSISRALIKMKVGRGNPMNKKLDKIGIVISKFFRFSLISNGW